MAKDVCLKNLVKKIRFFIDNTDPPLWLATIAALSLSILLIASLQRSGEYNYLRSQLIAAGAGLILAVVISNSDYRFYVKKWYFFAGIAVLLALLVFIFGIKVSGTDDTAWIEIFGGYTVQPSEFIKVCLIITFTKHLSLLREKELINKPLGVLSLSAHAVLPIVTVHFQGDDGTALIFLLMLLTMGFLGGIKLRYFAALGGTIAACVPVIWSFYLNDEHRSRLLALFDIDGNALTNYGWQQYQGKLSIASGGLFGSGLFNGERVNSEIVPEQENDFILTVAGEELGFIGCMLIIFLLLIIILRILRCSRRSADYEGKLICGGVFALIASQTVINLGMVLGFLPVVGITLPLLSSGGSSVLSVLLCIGLVQSVKFNR